MDSIRKECNNVTSLHPTVKPETNFNSGHRKKANHFSNSAFPDKYKMRNVLYRTIISDIRQSCWLAVSNSSIQREELVLPNKTRVLLMPAGKIKCTNNRKYKMNKGIAFLAWTKFTALFSPLHACETYLTIQGCLLLS